MDETTASVAQINTLIQERLRSQNLESTEPVTATKWLLEAGMRNEMETRPGSYLRSLCRKGQIEGAQKVGSKWVISRV